MPPSLAATSYCQKREGRTALKAIQGPSPASTRLPSPLHPFPTGPTTVKGFSLENSRGNSTKNFNLASQESMRDLLYPFPPRPADLREVQPHQITSGLGQRWYSPKLGQILSPRNQIQSVLGFWSLNELKTHTFGKLGSALFCQVQREVIEKKKL